MPTPPNGASWVSVRTWPKFSPGGSDGLFPAVEQLESPGQFRLIEAGHTVGTFEVSGSSLSVDTAEQLEQA
jgi:hypothetical protein